MLTPGLPSRDEMISAVMGRNTSYDGVFVTAVTTTGIFCRPSCPARKPKPENIEFFATARDAVLAGYRPCQRCTPLRSPGTAPEWLSDLLGRVEKDPSRRWTDADLRALELGPDRVRRWFQKHHGITFHAYWRARRLGLALGQIQEGSSIMDSAFDLGYESLSGFNDAFKQVFGVTPGSATEIHPAVVNRIVTPLGPMLGIATEDALCLLEFVDRRMLERQIGRLRRRFGYPIVPGTNDILGRADRELAAYFKGELREFSVPLAAAGTEFQQLVWEGLLDVPFGRTISYGDLAAAIGRPSAVRAVGRAVGDNPLAIIVPCHRIVGHDGRLTGYGGGLWRKKKLLAHERETAPPTDGQFHQPELAV